jgi:hypothetical protein
VGFYKLFGFLLTSILYILQGFKQRVPLKFAFRDAKEDLERSSANSLKCMRMKNVDHSSTIFRAQKAFVEKVERAPK